MFGWREAYMTFSMGDFAKARDALDDKRIQYKYITRSNGISGFSMGTSRSYYGSFGVNSDYAYQYTLFVKKQDFEEAQYLINIALH